MNEFFFALFILTGFLIGTLLFGHFMFLSFHSLPNVIRLKTDVSISSKILFFLKTILPLGLWLVLASVLTLVINNFFSSYLKLFYCEIAISFVFVAVELFKRKK